MNIDLLTWARLVLMGYLITISIETPVLFVGLGNRYSAKEKLFAGAFLTACSYPFVTIFFPMIWNPYEQYTTYMTVSEIFAPLSECAIFAWIFHQRKSLSKKARAWDMFVVILANLISFLAGELMKAAGLRIC